jgi:hypothetical protein
MSSAVARTRARRATGWIIRATATAILAGVAAACGDDAEVDGGSTERVAIRAQAPATYRDACEIVTAEDVAAVEGQPMQAQPDEARVAETACSYGPPGSSMALMSLTIHWRDGRQLWEAWGMGRDFAGRMMADPTADSLIAWESLEGIGDAVRYGDIMPSLVLVDDVLLELHMSLVTDSRAKFAVLARKAVSRL